MPERLEVGYIIINPDPDPEEYADTITVTKAERHKEAAGSCQKAAGIEEKNDE